MEDAVSKNEVMQLQIDEIADQGREENKGRQEMLHLWEKTVRQLAERDEDFSKLGQVSFKFDSLCMCSREASGLSPA